jgi:hypothetical protein
VRILKLKLIFSFPSAFFSLSGFPTNFDYGDPAPLELLDFSVYDLYWLFYELDLVIKTNFFERYYNILFEQTILEIRYLKDIVHVA